MVQTGSAFASVCKDTSKSGTLFHHSHDRSGGVIID